MLLLVSYQRFPFLKQQFSFGVHMATRSFIVGTKQEKEEIERLLFRYQPGNVSYEYAFLCNSLLEMMYEYGVRNINEYDYVVCEFLYEVKTDVRERLEKYTDNFEDYLLDIENALEYFKVYLETLDCIPIPFNMKAREGTYSSVMILEVER